MEFVIKEIDNDGAEIEDVKSFLYNQIKKEYGIGPDMRFHYDIEFIEDHSSHEERDEYDFLVTIDGLDLKIDVKTRTENFHIRTLEMVEQAESHPKDIYVSARLYRETNTVKLLGWFSFDDMKRIGRIENQGYLDNYVMYDSELRPISELYDYYLIKCKKQ